MKCYILMDKTDDSRQEAEKNQKLDNSQLEELDVRELKAEVCF